VPELRLGPHTYQGREVPDKYAAPTATLALREIISLKNDANGNIEAIFLPNLVQPAVSFGGNISNGSTMTTPDGVAFGLGALLNSSAALYTKLTNYRITSWGLRIRNTSSVTSAQGVLTVSLVNPHTRARIPNNSTIGGQGAAGAGAAGFTAAAWYNNMGIPSTGSGSAARLDISSLVDFPFHARYQGVQLTEETFEIHPKITDPSAFEFRDSTDSTWGSDMQATTSAVYVQPGDATYLRCDGWTAVVLGFSGGTAVVGQQTLDVEVVYHIEGSPNVSSGTVFITETPRLSIAPVVAEAAQVALALLPSFTRVGGAAMAAVRSFRPQGM